MRDNEPEQREAIGLAEAPSPPLVAPSRLRRAADDRLGGLPRVYWIVWAGTLLNRIGTFVDPFLVLYLTRARGFSVGGAGAVLTVVGVGGFLSQPIGGALADRIGRRKTLAYAMWSSAAAMLLLGAARPTPLIVLAAFLFGLTIDLYRPASQALVADVVGPQDRARAYGLLFWAINLGWAVATTTAGFLAGHGWTLLFVGDALTSALFGLLVWRMVSEPVRHVEDHGGRGGFATALRDRPFLGFVGLQFLYACVLFQIFISVPLAMRADGLSNAAFGISFAVNGLVIVIVQPLVVARLTQLPRSPLLAVSSLLFALGFASLAFAHDLPSYAGLLALATVGEIGVASVASAVVADFAPPAFRGRYYGVYGIAFGAAAIVAPAVGSFVFATWGADAVWVGCAIAGVAMFGGQLALTPAIKARTGASLAGASTAP